MKRILCLVAFMIAVASLATAGNLYKVALTGESDAELLRRAEVEPVFRLTGAYLVLADSRTAADLEQSGLLMMPLASDIEVSQIFVDNRFDRENVKKHSIIFEEGSLRLFRIDSPLMAKSAEGAPLIPIDNSWLEIEYQPPLVFNEKSLLGTDISLDSLIDQVSQDSIDVYLHRLEAYLTRVTGSDSLFASRDWLAERFASFGYTPIIDTFFYNSGADTGFNVVAIKPGTVYPGRQVIIGGHYDGVPGSPAVDDNGSGTVGVLEFARTLFDEETEMTFIFIAFDAEEVGLKGAYSYAGEAAARGDTIVYMLNMDMIGNISNDGFASLHQGPDDEPFALLWGKLADSLVGIAGVITGQSGGSDHYPFGQYGYDVTFVQEYNFSSVYHQPKDSTTYINFDYMTRMVKASLATAYVVNGLPMSVPITSIYDVGDGHSLQINWEPADPAQIDHYWLHYTTVPATVPDSILIPVDSSTYIVDGLKNDTLYSFHIIPVDHEGRSSVSFTRAYGTPRSIPVVPSGLLALPLKEGILLSWNANNLELDFDHYALFRDGLMIPENIADTSYLDDDAALDGNLHEYFVAAVDVDGNLSDTVSAERVIMRKATLETNRILAINRSANNTQAMVNEVVTGEFMREALTGYEFTYFSDTSATNPNRANLLDMIDYELVVIGAESGRRQDDIGNDPAFGGILEDIGYYLSIGGKVIIFGRWGDIDTEYDVDTIFYVPDSYQAPYTDYFNIAYRVLPLTYINPITSTWESDMIGAYGQLTGYPDLVWDSAATVNHNGSSLATTGIPSPSYPFLTGSDYEVLYTYNSLSDSVLTEGQPVAWRYLGLDYKYACFDIPLSFIQRPAAVEALRRAVLDMGLISDIDDGSDVAVLPTDFSLSQNYPNPFNPRTVIEFYNPKNKAVEATLEVFNILGQRTRLLFGGPASPGLNRIEWDGLDDAGDNVATGIYFYRLKIDDRTMTRKMVMLK